MIARLRFAWLAALLVGLVGSIDAAIAAEIDAVIDDASRAFTKMKKSPEKLNYCKLKLDSKGRVVGKTYTEGLLTPETKIVMGTFDEKSKKWTSGEAVEDGVKSDMFRDKGKTLRVDVKLADDDKTIVRILVKNDDERLVNADKEYDAVLKEIGRSDGYGTTIWYIRQELDDKGEVVKTFGLTSGFVRKETIVAMGKFNESTKKWEAGEVLEKGIHNDLFKQLGVKAFHVWMIPRDDKQGLAELLVKRIGD